MQNLINKINGSVSIYAENINSGEKYLLNEISIMPSASVIKLPILLKLYKLIDSNEININDKISFSSKDIVEDSPYFEKNNLKEGYADLYNIAHSMITVSDNTSTNLLIDFLGMDNINILIQKIGMNNTYLKRKMCDFEKRSQGIDNLTTALDMAKFFKYILKLKDEKPFNQMFKIITEQEDLEKIPSGFKNANFIIANKPGELPNIRNDCALLVSNANEIVISVLTENVEDEEKTDILIGEISRKLYDFLI